MNYQDINLTNRLVSTRSPLFRLQKESMKTSLVAVPVVRAQRLKVSQTSIRNLIQRSDTASAVGTVANADSASVTITLTPDNVFNGAAVQGNPYVAIYQGTVAVGSMQIFPSYGSGITVTDWDIHSGFDYNYFAGTQEKYTVNVANISGGDLPIYVDATWKYVSERAGTANV